MNRVLRTVARRLRPHLPGVVGGAASLDTPERIRSFAGFLADWGGPAPAAASTECTRLLALPGTSVLVLLEARRTGSTLAAAPGAGHRAELTLGPRFRCATWRPAEEADDPPRVLVLWARSGRAGAFALRYPSYARRLSLVANGRLLAAARPLEADAEPFSFELGAV